MNVVKFYFVNALEIFIGAIIILLSVKIKSNNLFSNEYLTTAVNFFMRPLILVIFLPMSSKIIGAMVSGSSLADTSNVAGGAFRSMLRTTSIGGIGKGLMGGRKGERGIDSVVRSIQKTNNAINNRRDTRLRENTDEIKNYFNK